MDVTIIMLHQLSGCLKSFKGWYGYLDNISFEKNVEDYIFRNHITYGTRNDYTELLRACAQVPLITKDHLDMLCTNVDNKIKEMRESE